MVKALSPTNDNGLFNLYIDDPTAPLAINVGNGGTTGEQTVSVGSYIVGETAGAATDLANYTNSITCRDLNGLGDPPIASCTNCTSLAVTVGDGDDIVCVISNNAIPPTATGLHRR